MPNEHSFHFLSGLPRSGSTLTAATLRQNPRFHAGMSSPIAGFFDGLIAQVSADSELSSTVTQDQRKRFLKGLFESYYGAQPEPVIFDTNRAWTAQLPALMGGVPECQSHLPGPECRLDHGQHETTVPQEYLRAYAALQHPGGRSTVYTRVEAMAGANRLVGYPWHALRAACYSEFADRIVIVDYDLLTQRPADVFKLLYEFLGDELFEHDFDAVSYDAPDFDAQLGLDGLHRVRPSVAPRPRETILLPDLFQRYAQLSFWHDLPHSRAFRIIAEQPNKPQDQQMPNGSNTIADSQQYCIAEHLAPANNQRTRPLSTMARTRTQTSRTATTATQSSALD